MNEKEVILIIELNRKLTLNNYKVLYQRINTVQIQKTDYTGLLYNTKTLHSSRIGMAQLRNQQVNINRQIEIKIQRLVIQIQMSNLQADLNFNLLSKTYSSHLIYKIMLLQFINQTSRASYQESMSRMMIKLIFRINRPFLLKTKFNKSSLSLTKSKEILTIDSLN